MSVQRVSIRSRSESNRWARTVERAAVAVAGFVVMLTMPVVADAADGVRTADGSGPHAPVQIAFEAPGPVPLLPAYYGLLRHRTVTIADDRLHPRRVGLRAGEMIRWESRSSDPSRIVFDEDVARHMVCDGLVNFELRGGRLQSAPMQTGDVAYLCRPAPGRYRYRVDRRAAASAGRSPRGSRSISSQLEGVIIVRAGSGD